MVEHKVWNLGELVQIQSSLTPQGKTYEAYKFKAELSGFHKIKSQGSKLVAIYDLNGFRRKAKNEQVNSSDSVT